MDGARCMFSGEVGRDGGPQLVAVDGVSGTSSIMRCPRSRNGVRAAIDMGDLASYSGGPKEVQVEGVILTELSIRFSMCTEGKRYWDDAEDKRPEVEGPDDETDQANSSRLSSGSLGDCGKMAGRVWELGSGSGTVMAFGKGWE